MSSSPSSGPPGQSPTSGKVGVPTTSSKLFERLLGLLERGKGADIVLWRNKPLSAGILGGVTVTWLFMEVVGYHFLTLLCLMAILAMAGVFIWCNGSALLGLPRPEIPEVKLSAAFKQLNFESKLDRLMSTLRNIACGDDCKSFLLTIASLVLLSAIGSCCSFLGLLYFVFLCILTLPVSYKKYKTEVDHLTNKVSSEFKKRVEKFNEKFLTIMPKVPLEKERVR